MNPKYDMTQKENIFLAKRNIVDYIWKSANLEGIAVTYPDTQAIYNGMAVSGYTIEDINAVNDLKHAWQYLLDHINDTLDLGFVKKVHMLLGKFTVLNAGIVRRDEVRIGGTEWIPEVPDEKRSGMEIAKIADSPDAPLERALDITLYLMRTQLFYDGNKRIAMLIGNKIMIEFYTLLVAYYETNDKMQLKQFLYDNCVDGMAFSR